MTGFILCERIIPLQEVSQHVCLGYASSPVHETIAWVKIVFVLPLHLPGYLQFRGSPKIGSVVEYP